MFLINCPYCGPRDESEFTCGGEAHIARPLDPDALDDAAWFFILTKPAMASRLIRASTRFHKTQDDLVRERLEKRLRREIDKSKARSSTEGAAVALKRRLASSSRTASSVADLLHSSTRVRVVSAPPSPDDERALRLSRSPTCVPPPACYHLHTSSCVLRPACIHLRTSTCVPPRGATLKLHLHLRTSLSLLSR